MKDEVPDAADVSLVAGAPRPEIMVVPMARPRPDPSSALDPASSSVDILLLGGGALPACSKLGGEPTNRHPQGEPASGEIMLPCEHMPGEPDAPDMPDTTGLPPPTMPGEPPFACTLACPGSGLHVLGLAELLLCSAMLASIAAVRALLPA